VISMIGSSSAPPQLPQTRSLRTPTGKQTWHPQVRHSRRAHWAPHARILWILVPATGRRVGTLLDDSTRAACTKRACNYTGSGPVHEKLYAPLSGGSGDGR
jgi:hypothetical protein